jgi:hypothetical protein
MQRSYGQGAWQELSIRVGSGDNKNWLGVLVPALTSGSTTRGNSNASRKAFRYGMMGVACSTSSSLMSDILRFEKPSLEGMVNVMASSFAGHKYCARMTPVLVNHQVVN